MEKQNPYTSELRIVSKFSADDFIPDGNLDKGIWQKADRVVFDHDWMGKRHFPESSTQVACLWTPSHFFFALWCRYTDLNVYAGEDPATQRFGLWDRDVAEVFLNPFPETVNHYFEFEVAPNNQWVDLEINLDKDPSYDHTWDSNFLHATRVDPAARIWTCEIKIPAASMRVPSIRPNWECRVNFYRCDGPGDDTQRRFLAWSPTFCTNPSDFFHVPTRFGQIRFE
jgi:alpha-galactosidase